MRRFIFGLAVCLAATLAPTWVAASDQATAQRIANALRTSGQLVNYSVGVKYQQGTVWLMGRVASQEQMDLALEIAQQRPEVTEVVNNLEVKPAGRSTSEANLPENPASYSEELVANEEPIESAARHRVVRPAARHPVVRPAARQVLRNEVLQNEELQDEELQDGEFQDEPSDGSDAIMTAQAQEPIAAPGVRPATRPSTAGKTAGRAPANAPAPRPLARIASRFKRSRPLPMGQSTAANGPHAMVANRNTQQGAPVVMEGYDDAGMVPVNGAVQGGPVPMHAAGMQAAGPPAYYDQPHMPNCAWPSYASYPNYAGVTYPQQYSPTAWPYIGPFYPYPQVPLGWRKVTLEWDDGWWFLDFDDRHHH